MIFYNSLSGGANESRVVISSNVSLFAEMTGSENYLMVYKDLAHS